MNELYLNVALVPLIMGCVAVLKTAGLPKRFAPLASICLGVLGVLSIPHDPIIGVAVITGIGTGLAASGLYSGAKATVKGDS